MYKQPSATMYTLIFTQTCLSKFLLSLHDEKCLLYRYIESNHAFSPESALTQHILQ